MRVGDFFSNFIDITSGLSYHLEQKISKNKLPFSVQPVSDGQTDRRMDTHSEIINIDKYIVKHKEIFPYTIVLDCIVLLHR